LLGSARNVETFRAAQEDRKRARREYHNWQKARREKGKAIIAELKLG
jgi:hypothetical protein